MGLIRFIIDNREEYFLILDCFKNTYPDIMTLPIMHEWEVLFKARFSIMYWNKYGWLIWGPDEEEVKGIMELEVEDLWLEYLNQLDYVCAFVDGFIIQLRVLRRKTQVIFYKINIFFKDSYYKNVDMLLLLEYFILASSSSFRSSFFMIVLIYSVVVIFISLVFHN